ncbi:membrane-associated phospholipid phosphatase [Litorivivens lipolytica]|uniref:undecaprenyl-diphosphate phosphatase n=1 Tax=Litorivivens lipolytica TaxID=1524264 RepID=A0A7W4W562_9GAMM|nr:phosphatase PAP2 family protein [Litorivivens lipolytica]MBB3047535.1 membrane-associated phospholipid phosphatase [Litorivivens lipolytica]
MDALPLPQLPPLQAADSPILYTVLQGLLWLGANGFLFLLPLVVFTLNRRLGVRLVLVFALSAVINCLLKNLLELPRPQAMEIDSYGTFGFPSSHAHLGVVFWGMLALHWRRWSISLLALLMVLLTSAAPLLLKLHFSGDILGGWALGLITLVLTWRYQQPVEAFLVEHGPLMQLGVALAITTLCWLLAGFYLDDPLLTGSIGFFIGCALAAIAHPHDAIHPNTLIGLGLRYISGMLLVILMVAALQRLSSQLVLSETLASSAALAILGGWLVGGVPTLLDFLASFSVRAQTQPSDSDD